MTDFIPGESYRLDIVGADESILLDSWSNKLTANVVSKDGALQVDVENGKVYGPLIGDILDYDGTTILDTVSGKLTADVIGNLLDDNNNVIVDSSLSIVNADLQGNVVDPLNRLVVDVTNRVVDADAVYGTFYGDLVGTVNTESTLFGAFSGDFNGSHYGEFYGDLTGDIVGTLNGDVVGTLTGTMTGSLIGEVMSDEDNSLMSPPNEEHNQWNWLGGLGHPVQPADNAVARGPIVVLGDTRDDSALRGHIQHYSGANVVQLDVTGNSAWLAEFTGKFTGELYASADTPLVTYDSNNGRVIVKSYGILSLDANNGNGDLNFIGDTATFNVRGPQTVRSFRGNFDNKQALQPDDCVLQFDAEGYDGEGWRQGGGFGIYIDDSPINETAYKTYFGIALSDGVNGPDANESKSLIFDSSGTLSVPITKLTGTTFSQRDSMAPAEGTIIFNTSSKKFQGYNGTAWVDLG